MGISNILNVINNERGKISFPARLVNQLKISKDCDHPRVPSHGVLLGERWCDSFPQRKSPLRKQISFAVKSTSRINQSNILFTAMVHVAANFTVA
ncbi:hypothetical protein J6590_099116, partial [Homalodisca vitripennis]